MPEWTPQIHLQEAFRKQLFQLVDQYLSFPDDATHGKIVRTLWVEARSLLMTAAKLKRLSFGMRLLSLLPAGRKPDKPWG